MSHQDKDRHTASAPNHQALKQALDWILSPASLEGVKFRSDCTWTPKLLIFVAILWSWSDEKSLTERYAVARKIVIRMSPRRRPPAKSYQAFMKMLNTWTAVLVGEMMAALRERMQTDLAERFTIFGFNVFGVDGSRLATARTKSNEGRYSPAGSRKRRKRKSRGRARTRSARERRAREKKCDSPQMWLTTMFHLGAGLPWDWRLGPSDSNEREHFQQMIDALPDEALVTADAGFVGYDRWKALLDSGRHLLIRVGSNVRLLRKLGYVEEKAGLVYLWPAEKSARKERPLVLRLVVAVGGKHPVYIVTSVLDETALSDEQVVHIYALRWGVELFYRHFKQSFERRKLRGHSADNVELEATWSLLGFWAMALHAEVQLARAGVPARRMSVAGILRAYRKSMKEYKSRPDDGESLRELVSKAVIDHYKRKNKSSRDHPCKKRGHVIGGPKIWDATEQQIKIARQIKDEAA